MSDLSGWRVRNAHATARVVVTVPDDANDVFEAMTGDDARLALTDLWHAMGIYDHALQADALNRLRDIVGPSTYSLSADGARTLAARLRRAAGTAVAP